MKKTILILFFFCFCGFAFCETEKTSLDTANEYYDAENYESAKEKYDTLADKILYTGMIDEYFNYEYGNLEWRSLKFENEILEKEDNYQGNNGQSRCY